MKTPINSRSRKLTRSLASLCLLATTGLTSPVIAADQPVNNDGDLEVAPPVPRKSSVNITKESEERLAWWREARFGLFIHWGLYSITGKGGWDLWSQKMNLEEYAKLKDQFSAEKFSAKEWVQTAKDAGMQYMVLVTKHHDGFALFDSKEYPFNSMASAAKRDFVKEISEEAHKEDMRLGFYYSPLDWQYPGYFFPDLYLSSAEAMREKYHHQMRELMKNYGKVDILWYDGGGPNWLAFGGVEFGGKKPGWNSRDRSEPYKGKFSWQDDVINNEVRALQPGIILNDRTATLADFETREGGKQLGDFNNKIPWEHCNTLAGPWGYMPGRTPMSLEKCIQLLVNTVGRDGNLLLNVGPRPDGSIEPAEIERLKEIGQWLKTHGESIYKTRGGPFLPAPYGAATHAGKTIYVHWLAPGSKLTLPNISAKILKASILGGGPDVEFSQNDKTIEISVPAAKRPAIDTIVALELDRNASEIQPVEVTGFETTDLTGVRLERNIDYLGEGPAAPKADLYSPEHIAKGQRCPAVVLIHGGGWVGGDKADGRERNIGTTLARNGYIVLSVNYTLGEKGKPTWPLNLQQCKTAVRWLRKNADKLKINPEKIGAIGGSAGGHLASMLGVTGPFDGLDPVGPYGEYSCQVQAVVDMYGPIDLMAWKHESVAIGATKADKPEVFRQASPTSYLRKGNPPFLILHGTKDETVPVDQSIKFAEALKAAGVEYKLVVLDGAEHTFDLQPPNQKDLRPLVLGFFDRFLKTGN